MKYTEAHVQLITLEFHLGSTNIVEGPEYSTRWWLRYPPGPRQTGEDQLLCALLRYTLLLYLIIKKQWTDEPPMKKTFISNLRTIEIQHRSWWKIDTKFQIIFLCGTTTTCAPEWKFDRMELKSFKSDVVRQKILVIRVSIGLMKSM